MSGSTTMQIDILGKPYTVEYLDETHMQSNMGAAQRTKQLIFINKDNSKENQEDTLLHEILHIIDRELSLDMDEKLITRLACGLHSAGYGRKE